MDGFPKGTKVNIVGYPFLADRFGTVEGFGFPDAQGTGGVSPRPRSGMDDPNRPKYLVRLDDREFGWHWLRPENVALATPCSECGEEYSNNGDYLCGPCRKEVMRCNTLDP
jgi:hypothetical protein